VAQKAKEFQCFGTIYRHEIAAIGCIISGKIADLIYIVAEAKNQARRNVLLFHLLQYNGGHTYLLCGTFQGDSWCKNGKFLDHSIYLSVIPADEGGEGWNSTLK